MKLPQVKGKELISFVKKLGYVHRKTKSGHQVFIDPNSGKHVTIPTGKREITKGTLSNILRQMNMGREEFIDKF